MSKKKKIIIAIFILAIILLVVIRLLSFIQNAANQDVLEQSYIPVNAQTVQKGTIASTITLTGKVEPLDEVYIMIKTPATVQSLAVRVGDTVTKDQVLLALDKDDLQSSYNQAAAALAAAQANYQAAKEQNEKAVSDLAKYQELYEAEVISKDEYEQAKLMASGSSLSAAQAQVDQAQAGLAAVGETINDMNIKSPIAGIVTALTVGEGDMATNASPVAIIVNMDQVYVNISVSENIINSIKIGQEVSVEIPSAGADNLTGRIDDLSLAADASTGKYSMKIYIDNSDHLLKSGMFAQVSLDTDTRSDVIVVPTDVIVYHNGEYVAYVVSDQKAVEKVVETGLDNGEEIEVVNGLQAGDILIISGQRYVIDGSIVKVIELDGVKAAEEIDTDSGTEGAK